MSSYDDYLPAYLREHTGRNAEEWERRLRQWQKENGGLPTCHWTKIGHGQSLLGIWKLWRVQDEDLHLSDQKWMHKPAMHVLTRTTSTRGTEIDAAGFLKISPLHLPPEDLREVSSEARKKDLRQRQKVRTEPFDSEMIRQINRLYAVSVRENVVRSLRSGDLTLLRGRLCVPPVSPRKFEHPLEDFKKRLVLDVNLPKRTTHEVVEAVNKDMWWLQYNMVDDEKELPSLYLAEIELVNNWKPDFY